MAEELQSLIEKINRDGIEKAAAVFTDVVPISIPSKFIFFAFLRGCVYYALFSLKLQYDFYIFIPHISVFVRHKARKKIYFVILFNILLFF